MEIGFGGGDQNKLNRESRIEKEPDNFIGSFLILRIGGGPLEKVLFYNNMHTVTHSEHRVYISFAK